MAVSGFHTTHKVMILSNYRDNGMRQTNRDSLDDSTANEGVHYI